MTTPTRRKTNERGYDKHHKAERQRWEPIVNAGNAHCTELVCLEENEGGSRWIEPHTPWHLAHDTDQTGYRGPAHARCNISEASRRTHQANKAAKTPKETRWWTP